MSTLVVINPASANRRTEKLWPRLREQLRKVAGDFEEAFTSGPGQATELTRRALRQGTRRVISVGGDGTNNEVLNGFFDDTGQPVCEEAEMGLVPSGTGGDFRKTLGLTAPDAWAEALRRGHSRRVDVGLVEFTDHQGQKARRFFLNIVSFGLSGRVDDTVNRTTKILGGKASFLLGTLRAILGWRNQRARLVLSGPQGQTLFDQQLRLVTVAAANGQYFGGGMWIAPRARIDDGLLDVVVLGDIPKSTLLTRTGRIYRGTHLKMKNVWMLQASSLEATSEEKVLIDLDGEAVGRLPIRVRIMPGALRLICL